MTKLYAPKSKLCYHSPDGVGELETKAAYVYIRLMAWGIIHKPTGRKQVKLKFPSDPVKRICLVVQVMQ